MLKFGYFSRLVKHKYGSQVYETFGKYNKKLKSIEMPKKFKGTFVEKWVTYWKDVYRDYLEVVKDSAKDIQNTPWKGVALLSAFTSGAYLVSTNPDENNFRNTLVLYCNELILIGSPIRNPKGVNHLRSLEQHYNEGTIRRFSFGLFSVMWIDNYNDCLGIYKAVCPYLKPEYFRFYERIVDVGFCNKWWIIEKKMIDIDVNPNEWIDTEES